MIDTYEQKRPYYLITGGAPLHGEVVISGAKNAVTKMIIASLLTSDLCTLRNVPLLGDLDLTVKLCEDFGSQVQLDDDTHTLTLHTEHITSTVISSNVGGLNRMSVMAIGPLLHRCGEATIPLPGGDRIGPRPINFHIQGLQQMGAKIVRAGWRLSVLYHGAFAWCNHQTTFPKRDGN